MPTLLSPLVPALSSPPMPALLSCSILGQALTHLASSALEIFKQALLDELLRYRLPTPSLAELLCPFLTLGLLIKNNDHKQPYDTAFINSRLLIGNHDAG